MRFSPQTVGLTLGVTLVHLLVIAVFTPVERRLPRPGIALDPELEAFLETDQGDFVGPVEANEVIEAPLYPLDRARTESASLPAESATLENPSLAGNDESVLPVLAREEPTVRNPNSVMREFRPIAPRPRS